MDKQKLDTQIEQERKELEAAPKIPIHTFMGTTTRCHLCGQVFPAGVLEAFDTHIPGITRYACPNCHPNRGQHAG